MVLKVLKKLDQLFYYYVNRKIFDQVNCNLATLNIGSEIHSGFIIKHPQKLTIGDNTAISGNCLINALGGVKIGRYCHIARGLTVYSHNHNFKSKELIPYDNEMLVRPVEIGDAVWIGVNVTISPGAKIGNGVIISSGAVVFGDIPDCAIIRGNPAQIIKYRDQKVFWKLFKEGKFS